MYGGTSSFESGCFMKDFCLNTICNITQELQRLKYVCGGFIVKSAVIKYHQLLSKVTSIKRKLRFNQLATASSSNPSLLTLSEIILLHGLAMLKGIFNILTSSYLFWFLPGRKKSDYCFEKRYIYR